jgi:cytochrome c oxidase subunit 3
MRQRLQFRAGGERDYSGAAPAFGKSRPERDEILSTALWAFIAMATSLFALFIASYLMRIQSSDWHPIALPRQLWLSTALLLAASAAMHCAGYAARRWHGSALRKLLLGAGLCMFAFLAVQSWAWQALLANQVSAVGNPAASYFYLLTAMHGLHVAGGLIAWAIVARGARQRSLAALPWLGSARRIGMCARYWDFLLLAWLALFATMSGLSGELIRFVCGTS